MFVSFRKCSPPQKPDPISDRNCQNLYPFSDQNGSKTIPFGAAHTYIPYIGEYPPPPPGVKIPSKKYRAASGVLNQPLAAQNMYVNKKRQTAATNTIDTMSRCRYKYPLAFQVTIDDDSNLKPQHVFFLAILLGAPNGSFR